MNNWRIKRAYKHRTFPPLNSHEKLIRETALPFIYLKRSFREMPKMISAGIRNACDEIAKFNEERYKELKPYFGRVDETDN